jgi:hypothetical protein
MSWFALVVTIVKGSTYSPADRSVQPCQIPAIKITLSLSLIKQGILSAVIKGNAKTDQGGIAYLLKTCN